ncbi:MAG TPA: SIR2 family protein [Longimicrobium sp.]|nr:SIR2 family protein [Longimicrobium sp.]
MERIAGFGAERFPLEPRSPRTERVERSRIMLARALNLRTVVAFIGSGCSAPLGYPTWRELVGGVVQATRERCRHDPGAVSRLDEIQTRLQEPSLLSRDLIFYLGFCQSLLQGAGDEFHELIAGRIAAASRLAGRRRPGDHNPHRALLRLPIDRFITSNYDCELEAALRAFRGCAEPHSFTQEPEDYGSVAGFALAGMPRSCEWVFHCHGTFARPGSIVATEADYQRWYLDRSDPTAAAFRQSLDLLFGSNPVLFIGFGMEDDDLLRPLRAFSAHYPDQKPSRPLFALLPDEGTARDHDRVDSLYDRYGVHVIPYRLGRGKTPAARGRALRRAIDGLHDTWLHYAEGWQRKPAIRKVDVRVRPPEPYRHYAAAVDDDEILAPQRTRDDVEGLEKLVQDPKTRVVVISGDGGSGKSLRVLRLLDSLKVKPGRFSGGIFFWSSYYADDWLTGLDRALDYLEDPPRDEELASRATRLSRFRDCLRSGTHLLVFDGFERLLRESDDPNTGLPYSRSVERLLQAISEHEHGKTRSTVILTTRLMPQPLKELEELGRVRRFAIRRLTTSDLKETPLFAPHLATGELTDEDLSGLCSLCGGHSYALLLAARYILGGPQAVPARLRTFRWEISRRAPDSRVAAVIGLALQAADDGTGGLASRLLERFAVFMSPVDTETLAVCASAAGVGGSAERERVVQALLDARLLLEVSADPSEAAPRRGSRLLTVHPIVRGYVYQRRHGAESEGLPNFTLAGFTSGNASCHPGDERGAANLSELFDTLCARASQAGLPRNVRVSVCRAAFGLMRSRMESNTVPRWTNYQEYVKLGVRLLYIAKELSAPDLWTYRERTYAAGRQSKDGILFPDELAWLYNDIGLALCSEGYMADAYALWEQGYEIDRVTDSEEEGGQYIVQSRLHMSHLFMELGRLRRASQYLATTERANAVYGDPDFHARIVGYRGLLAHLAGNLDEADELYAAAIGKLAREGRRNLRAESIFQRHWADLKLARRDRDGAEACLETAFSRAREGDFPDLEAYARKARGHFLRDRDRLGMAQAEYGAALQAAHRLGIKRLQADVLSELSRLALAVGDWETARTRAVQSLMIANELSLGLRRTHGLVVLGLAEAAGGNTGLAASSLQHAYALAERQGYHLRGREAEEALQRLGAPTRPEPRT